MSFAQLFSKKSKKNPSAKGTSSSPDIKNRRSKKRSPETKTVHGVKSEELMGAKASVDSKTSVVPDSKGKLRNNAQDEKTRLLRVGEMVVREPLIFRAAMIWQRDSPAAKSKFRQIFSQVYKGRSKWQLTEFADIDSLLSYRRNRRLSIVYLDLSFSNESIAAAATKCARLRRDHCEETYISVVGIIAKSQRKQALISLKTQELQIDRFLVIERCETEEDLQFEIDAIERVDVSLYFKLRACKAPFKAIEFCDDPIEITDGKGIIQMVNKAFEARKGLKREQILGRKASELPTSDSSDNLTCQRRSKTSTDANTRRSREGWKHIEVCANNEDPQNIQTVHMWAPHMVATSSKKQAMRRIEPPITEIIKCVKILQVQTQDSDPEVTVMINRIHKLLTTTDVYQPRSQLTENTSETTRQLFRCFLGSAVGPNVGPKTVTPTLSIASATQPKSMGAGTDSRGSPSRRDCRLEDLLAKVLDWDFNIMDVEVYVGKGNVLTTVGSRLFKLFKVAEALSLTGSDKDNNKNKRLLKRFLRSIENQYHAKNSFHNSTHAADVMQAVAYFLKRLPLDLQEKPDQPILTPLEKATVLIAAAIHDVDHPGRTNQFLMAIGHECAIRYNDTSVLENHHMSWAWEHMIRDYNILQNLRPDDAKRVRQLLIKLVLATDMQKHGREVAVFSLVVEKIQSHDWSETHGLERQKIDPKSELMSMLLKIADISNPTRAWKVCNEWADRVMAEFDDQLKEEKKLNFSGYTVPELPKPDVQCFFINAFVREAFTVVGEVLTSFRSKEQPLDNLEENAKKWLSMNKYVNYVPINDARPIEQTAVGGDSIKSSSPYCSNGSSK